MHYMLRDKVPMMVAMACHEIGKRLAEKSRTYAPRTAREGLYWVVATTPVDTRTADDAAYDRRLPVLAAAAREALPHWAGTAKFVELKATSATGFSSDVCTDTRTGASCMVCVNRDHAGTRMAIHWMIEPVHAPGTWTRRKRHARYRRGRETVRPRHRRTR